MRFQSLLRRRRPSAGMESSPAAPKREQLTPEQLMDLKDAWSELSRAAKAAGVRSMRACTADGSVWEKNPEAVRRMAAMIRELPGPDTDASVEDRPAR